MKFKDIIEKIEQLIGIELQPINPSTDSLTITKVDRSTDKYYLTSAGKKSSRSFKELEKILDALLSTKFVNVEQALSGSGTSRSQPETVLANLPFIEHFKYERKKHLYLREIDTHELGTIQEVTSSDLKSLKKQIENFKDFDIESFHSEHERLTLNLDEQLSSIFKKYPGESDVDKINSLLDELKNINIKLSGAIINLDIDQNKNSNKELNVTYRESESDEEDSDDNDSDVKVDADYYDSSQGLKTNRISQVNPTVSLLYDRVRFGEIELQPEFQRKDRIWPEKDKSRLIESILLGLPLPIFYFAERPDTDWIIIDGLQRVTTLVDFMAGEFKLTDLERRVNNNSDFFKDLDRKDQRKVREYQIQGHLIQVSKESDEMVRELFQRINTYGKNLSFQEIRSALYPGSSTLFLRYISESGFFLDATSRAISPKRMLDMEYVLRPISYMIQGIDGYSFNKYDDFLCKTLKMLNKFTFELDGKIIEDHTLPQINEDTTDIVFNNLLGQLKNSFHVIDIVFGKLAFRKETTGKLNKQLFEIMVTVFAMMTPEELAHVEKGDNPKKIVSEFKKLLQDDKCRYANWISKVYEEAERGFDYSVSQSTGKKVTILFRFQNFINMINKVCGIDFKLKGILQGLPEKAITTWEKD